MDRRLPLAGAIAIAIALAVATLFPVALDSQSQSSTRVPRVLQLSFNDSLGAPVPPLALGQVSAVEPNEDAKSAARRILQGAVPALAESEMPATDWTVVGFAADADGVTHTKLQQSIGGLRVFGAEVAVHLNGSNVAGLNGEALVDLVDTSLKPQLTLEAAAKAARVELGLSNRLNVELGELVIYNPAIVSLGPSANYLAYQVVLASPEGDESYTALVDARAPKVLASFNNIASAKNRATYDLAGGRTLPGVQCHDETTATRGAHGECVSAHRLAGDTYDRFFSVLGRDSFDGAGGTMIPSVRYGTTANAFWNGRQTVFGPGFATRDVVAHEWAHGVTSTTARLIYVAQSGALNESMSDIFAATLVDADDWTIGEDLSIGAIRDMQDPTRFGDPGKVSDSQYFCGPGDNYGVHTNSGVPNHAAYLMAIGGTYNNQSVTAIGRENTAKIFYRALTTYLTAGSNFADAYTALQLSCNDQASALGINCAASVTAALNAVQMNQAACTANGTTDPDNWEDDDRATNSAVTGRTFLMGGSEQHTFHDAADADWVRFTVTANATVNFSTTGLGTNADTVLRVYDVNGTTSLAEDDDSGDGLGSQLVYTFTTAGTYYVRVVQYNPAVYGSNTGYTLRLAATTTTGDPFEQDNGFSTARLIAPGDVDAGHTYGVPADNDFKRFTATAGTTYVISTENLYQSSDTYLFLYRLDTSGPVLLAADDDGGGGLASRIEWTAPASGTYYVRSRHYSPAASGPNTQYDFRLATSTGPAVDNFEPDNLRAQARAITVGAAAQEHTAHAPSDHDWVFINTTSGTTYTISTALTGLRGDTILDLYSTNGTLITSNDDSGGTLASLITYTATSTGDLYVRVRQYNPSVYGPGTGYGLQVTTVTCGSTSGSDPYEPNNSEGAATVYTFGTTQSHNHACAGDRDWIRFQANQNVEYDLRTSNLGATADTVMFLYDSTGTLLAGNDDGGGGLASRIIFRAPADGWYYVMLRHYLPTATGSATNYDFTITSTGTAGTADSFEADNTQAAARAITTTTPHANHNFHAAGDPDWISFSATANTRYVVQTYNLGTFSDTIVQIYNGSTVLVTDDDGGGGLSSRAEFTSPITGTLHAKVYHYNPSTFGSNTNYDIRFGVATTTTSGGDSFEPDNSQSAADTNNRTLTTADSQLHTFHVAGDQDWTKFNAAANTTYTIFTANLGITSDTYLELYSSGGALLAFNDDGGGGLASRLLYTTSSAATLYVKVRHYSSATFGPTTNYELRMTLAAAPSGDAFEPDSTAGSARTIAIGATQANHTFHVQGDHDWAVFSATAGTSYRLETLALGPRSDTVLWLYDSTAATLLASNDDFSGLASRIDWTAPSTGTYYVRITHYSAFVSGADTNYDFRISIDSSGCTTGDSFEPDGTPAQARDLAVGSSQTGHTHGCAGDLDWIRLTGLTTNARYSIETFSLGAAADTYVTLYNGTGSTVLGENDDYGGTLASRLEFTATETAQRVRVRHFSASSFGSTTSYSIRLTLLTSGTGDSFEPDNTVSAARALTTSSPHANHNHHIAGDEDWMSVSVGANQTCVFETYDLGSRSDTVVHLYATNGTTQLAYDDDGGGYPRSRLSYPFTTAGTYYLKVRQYGSTTSGLGTEYSIRSSCTAAVTSDSFEPDNNVSQARVITVSATTSQRHIHDPAGDQDWVRFSATAGTSYVMETFDLGSSADTYLYLYSTNGVTLLRSNDDYLGLASRIVWTAPSSGTYYLLSRHYSSSASGANTAYSLRVRAGTADEQPAVEVTSEPGATPNTVQVVVRALQPAEEMKVELEAKPELLAFAGARSLLASKDGQTNPVSAVGMMPTAEHAGIVALHLDGKQLMEAIGSGNGVVAAEYSVLQPLPNGKTSVRLRVTLIDASGAASVNIVETTVESILGAPRVDSTFTPPSVPENRGRTAEINVTGSNFLPGKVFLVAGETEYEMTDVVLNGTTGLTFVIPDPGMPAGVYRVRVQNGTDRATAAVGDSEPTFVVGEACAFSLSSANVTVPGAGGPSRRESITVTTGATCGWQPQSSDLSWLTIVTPIEGATGTGTLTLEATSGPLEGRTATVTIVTSANATGNRTITVTQNPNSAPRFTAAPGNQIILVNQNTGSLPFGVTDDDQDDVVVTRSSSDVTLVPVDNIVLAGSGTNQTVTVTPAASRHGVATITLTANDGRRLETSHSFVVTVNQPPNDPPQIGGLADRSIRQNTDTGDIALEISDPNGDVLTITPESLNVALVPSSSIAVASNNRSMRITPVPGQFGEARINIYVTDGRETALASFVLTVTQNRAPVMSAMSDQTISRDTPSTSLSFTVTDPDGDQISLSGESLNQALVRSSDITFDGDSTQRTVRIAPLAGRFGEARININASDGLTTSFTTFVLTVLDNRNPVISAIGPQTINRNTSTADIAFTASDPDNHPITLSRASSNEALVPLSNIVFSNGAGPADRTVRVTPVRGGTGQAQITVTASDGQGGSAFVTFLITVTNRAPLLGTIADRTVNRDTPTGSIAFTLSDPDGDSISLTAATSNSAVVRASDVVLGDGASPAERTVRVTPVANQFGQARITITASDGVDSSTTSFVLNVLSNRNPVIGTIADRTIARNTDTGSISFTVSDPDGDSLSLDRQSLNETLVPTSGIVFGDGTTPAERIVRITPNRGRSGNARINITVSDGQGGSAVSSFEVSVRNQTPVIGAIADRIVNHDTPTGAILFTVSDPDGDSVTLSGDSTNPALVGVSQIEFGDGSTPNHRTVRVSPLARRSGAARITLYASDGTDSSFTSFVLTVLDNRNPVISAITDRRIARNSDAGIIRFTVSDPDGDPMILERQSLNEALVPPGGIVFGDGATAGERTVRVTPNRGRSGEARINITVSDGAGGSAFSSFVVTVDNQTPTISIIADRTVERDTPTGNIPFSVSDPDGDSITLIGESTNPALVGVSQIEFGDGASANERTVRITPLAGRSGEARISVTASDGTDSSFTSFLLTVRGNTNPVISPIDDRTIAQGGNSGDIPFTVSDPDGDPITLDASSSNLGLVPRSRIQFADGASPSQRTIRVTPLADQFGSAVITITLADSRGGLVTESFVLNVTQDPNTRLDPPTGLRTFVDGPIVTVQWEPPTAGATPTGYRIEAGRAEGQTSMSVNVGNVDRFTLNLSATGVWHVRVKGLRDGREGPASAEAVIEILRLIGRPQNFAAAVDRNTINVSWSSPTSGAVAQYLLQAGTGLGLSNLAEVPVGGASATSFSAPAPDGTYFLRLIAVNANGGRSLPTDDVRLVVPNTGTGTVPTEPRALQVSVNGNAIGLSWQPPTVGAPLTTYILDAGTTPGASNLASVPIGTMVTFSAVVPDGRYFVRIRAQNAFGAGPPSNEVDFTAGTTQAPGAPNALGQSVNGSSVTLTWAPPTSGGPVQMYVVDAGTASGLSNVAQAIVGTNTSITASVPNGRYFVRVRAVNNIGSSPASNEVIVQVGPSGIAPRVDSFTPNTVAPDLPRTIDIIGSGFEAPRVFLLTDGAAVEMVDVSLLEDGTRIGFVVPSAMSGGSYRIRVQNSDGTFVDSAGELIISQ